MGQTKISGRSTVGQYKKLANVPHHPEIAGIVRGLLNGVKHTVATFVHAHPEVSPQRLNSIMQGKAPLDDVTEHALVDHPTINQRYFYEARYHDLFPVIDDTNDGVLIMTAEETQATMRRMFRGPGEVAFYDYADTAMSNTSLFKPEWIRELMVHDGEDPALPNWAYNNGHCEFQLTYFIGPVNFYWRDKHGEKHVEKMHTGDTVFIAPLVPHTFTTREEGAGLILAVTYGGALATDTFQATIKAMSEPEFMAYAVREMPALPAKSDLEQRGGVTLARRQEARDRATDRYRISTLLEIDLQPNTSAQKISIKNTGAADANLTTSTSRQDQWGYNIGAHPVKLVWSGRKTSAAIINPGDSFLIQPNIQSGFYLDAHQGEPGTLLVMTIRPEAGTPLEELAIIHRYAGLPGLMRARSENQQWY